jgi:hypothetical protein
VSRRRERRGLREVKRRQLELSLRAAGQRAELARRAEGLSRFLRWATLGLVVVRALRAGASAWGAARAAPKRPA